MKELFELYAAYNKKANNAMIGILKKQPEDILRKDMKTYFKSIIETLMHMIFSDIFWLKGVNESIPYSCISNSKIIKTSNADIKEQITKDYKNAFKLKSELDELFEEYVKEINEKDLNKRIKYKNMRGQELERTYWHRIIHIFNHETHHRGVISAVLDQLNIENDYSGIALYVD